MPSQPLHALPGAEPAPAGPLDTLEARLEADSPQRGRSLLAAFSLVNAGESALELLNPLDLLQWQLLDGAGAPLGLPDRVPNLRSHPVGGEWRLNSAIPIAEVIEDGTAANAATLDSPRLTITRELAVTFAFDLASGDYRLIAIATLIDASDTNRSRILRSDPLPVSFERQT
jgi:hypothetical protein